MIGHGAGPFAHEAFNVPIPFDRPLRGFQPPHHIRIVGVPNPNASRFQINLMTDSEYQFHFNPRFDQNVVVRNNTRGGAWQNEERYENNFPFYRGRMFTVDVIAAGPQILVNVDGNQFISFNARDDLYRVNRLNICGDVAIHSVHITE